MLNPVGRASVAIVTPLLKGNDTSAAIANIAQITSLVASAKRMRVPLNYPTARGALLRGRRQPIDSGAGRISCRVDDTGHGRRQYDPGAGIGCHRGTVGSDIDSSGIYFTRHSERRRGNDYGHI
jgi:hypothetical protein